METGSNAYKVLKMDDLPRICCIDTQCEAVVHLRGVSFGPDAVKESTSGHGMRINLSCEEGHDFEITLTDHSGGMWIDALEK